ncbi:MAG: hypothetical protein QGI45_08730 [Myxococcota bacterium]|jgi:hypothetical protein|nr:hypothetical protein [Myxococcota bacterium]
MDLAGLSKGMKMLEEEAKAEGKRPRAYPSKLSLEKLDRATQHAMALLDKFKSECCHLRAARISPHMKHHHRYDDLAAKLNRSYEELGTLVEALTGTQETRK